jgi:hypothetical protein
MAALPVHSHDADPIAHDHAAHAAHALPQKTSLAKSVAHKCGACASCCLNAVVPTEAFLFETGKWAHPFASLVTRAIAAYVTEGLERPPRSFRA